MADYGVKVWDRSGQLGFGAPDTLAQFYFQGTVPAGGSITLTDMENRYYFLGWVQSGQLVVSPPKSYLSISYNAGTRVLTITNTSGANENDVVVMGLPQGPG